MKITGPELRRFVEEVVEQRLNEVLPQVIAEVLSERYLKKVVAEATARSSSLRELSVQGEPEKEEDPPEPLTNSDEGIYEPDPIVKENRRAQLRKIIDPEMSIFFEGTRPLEEVEEQAQVRIPETPEMKSQMKVWTTLAGINQKSGRSQAQTDATEQQRILEERLKRKREMLEVPVK